MIAIFSDHGEEFWDHGDFEHGHTLYDELLNVPYILKMPGIEVGMHDEPVSLLDLVPTTAKALEMDIAQTQGWALQEYSATDLKDRPQAFTECCMEMMDGVHCIMTSNTLRWEERKPCLISLSIQKR